MSHQMSDREGLGSNILTGALIFGSMLLLVVFLASVTELGGSQKTQATNAQTTQVVTAQNGQQG